jgi:hypothetical protein
MEMYVEGVSTRKVKDLTEELCGTSFSKSLLSSLATGLDAELEAWRSRPLEAEAYPYLFVDARYEKVRVGHRVVVSQGVLIASAVRAPEALREILGVEVADTESEATYQGSCYARSKSEASRAWSLWSQRRPRGAEGRRLSPLPGGVVAALPGALRQEPPRDGRLYAKRKDLAAELRAIFAATGRDTAVRLASELADRGGAGRATRRSQST